MIKRDITETVYEYDQEGKLVKKTITETHEEEDNVITSSPQYTYLNGGITLCSDNTTEQFTITTCTN